ncbi:MAG: flagellar hook-basal body complex protein FliE [Calditrichaeota bacterium]|nr:MAG: flagellar hook-basal body complex protein FliE [Calditrichota bacterium]
MDKIEALRAGFLNQIQAPKLETAEEREPQKFSETLGQLLDQVDELQQKAGKATEDFLSGNGGNLHEVMALGQEAQLSFQLMLEIRNKLVEAYQELSRMPV